jgi:exopolyphosphatase/guanosine-5'-triphosphate,3'-diphosphate pyrophosphatase
MPTREPDGGLGDPSGRARPKPSGEAAAPHFDHERADAPVETSAAGGEPRRHRASGPLYAALDLGTNNCRLLVAEPWYHGFRVVDAFSRIVRLGEGLSKSGRLSDAAQDRAIDALRVCRGKLDGRGIVRSRFVATEACRAAENGEAFLDRVEAETGLRLEILTRETEARLAVAGCANLIDWSADGALLFDIGGGSSELVWLEFGPGRRHGGDPTRHIRAWTSLPVGVVTLSERHGGVSVGASVFEAMVADVDAMLAELDDWTGLGARLGPGRYHMVGTSGTVTTLAGVHLGLKRYDRRRVDGTWLSDDQVGEMIDRLLEMDFDDRVANPCIGIDRADLVLAGCAILEAIRRRWRCGRLRVADRGLREGMLTELMMDDGLWYRSGRGRRPGRGGERSGR